MAGENGEIHNDIKAGDEKVKAELTEAITSGNAKTLTQAKSEDQKLKQEITALIEQKHKGILTLVKMKKHNSLDSSAELQAVITELNSLISDLIKCGIMSNT